ncbi:MAG: heparinase II/III-family protein, partial [Devosia sp.]|nr:heparinase II/III-family protein [Devosia sp.]
RYFTRRRLLNALVLAECVEAGGRFIDAITDGVFSICEESGWQLPAHNSYTRGGKRGALPDSSRPIVDLFAAETAAQLAVIAALLGPVLDQLAPEIGHRIDREVETRVIRPYLTTHFWWMGNGDERMNNWTAWCTQNLLWACFCLPTGQETRRAVLTQAANSLDAFVKDYGDDGGCEEGAAYYRHAGLCLFNALDTMAQVAPDAFAPLWSEPKLRNMADYISHMHVSGSYYFNFGDSAAKLEGNGAREFLFGRATGSALLLDFAAADWRRTGGPDLSKESNLAYRVQAAFAAQQMQNHQGEGVRAQDHFYPDIGLFIARDSRFALAVAAGHNGVDHNHNDIGSVTLYKDGRPLLIDVGVESYTAKTFSSRRYEIWTMRSTFHNLPSFAGIEQKDGKAYAAAAVQTAFTADEARISFDLAEAYPPEAGVQHYRRTVTLKKGRSIRIADSFAGSQPATLSLMVETRPELHPGRIVLPGLAEITLTGAGTMALEEIAVDDPRLRTSWPATLYRILVPLTEPELILDII